MFFFGECRWYYSFSNQPSSKLVSIYIFSYFLWLMKRNLYFNWQVRNTFLFLQLIYKELFLGILKWIWIIVSFLCINGLPRDYCPIVIHFYSNNRNFIHVIRCLFMRGQKNIFIMCDHAGYEIISVLSQVLRVGTWPHILIITIEMVEKEKKISLQNFQWLNTQLDWIPSLS